MLILHYLCKHQHKSCKNLNGYLFFFFVIVKTSVFGDMAPCGNGLVDVSQERVPPPNFMVEMSKVRIK